MADIFVSYSRNDRDRVRPIVEGLEKQGWSVWWDPAIMPGERYAQTIDAELKAAKCVLAVWSEASAASDWVHEEAEDGKGRGILLPVLIDDIEIPRGFRRVQTIDLSDWRGQKDHQGWAYVAAAATRYIRGGPAPAIKAPKTRRQKRRSFYSNLVMLALLATIAGGVWWGATHPAQVQNITQNTFVQTIINIFAGGGSEGAAGSGQEAASGQVAGATAEAEPNNDRRSATVVAPGTPVAAELSELADVDLFTLRATSGPRNKMTIRVENLSTTLPPDLRVLDGNGEEIAHAWNSTRGGDAESVVYAAPGETLYVQVRSWGNFAADVGAYRLVVSNDTTHPAAAELRNAAVEREPNASAREPAELRWRRPVLGHLHRDQDWDYYRFVAPNDGEARISVRAFSDTVTLSVYLYDAEREQVGHWWAQTDGADLVEVATLERGATYYVAVGPFNYDEFGDYVLEVGPGN